MRLLGVDLGTKSMGLSITDSNQQIINPLKTFTYPNQDVMQCANHIQKLCTEYNNIELVVIGLPNNPHGQTSKTFDLVQKLGQILSNKRIAYQFCSEEYTTVESRSFLKMELGLKNSEVKRKQDAISACKILERYLKH